jgi:hypothetical protein
LWIPGCYTPIPHGRSSQVATVEAPMRALLFVRASSPSLFQPCARFSLIPHRGSLLLGPYVAATGWHGRGQLIRALGSCSQLLAVVGSCPLIASATTSPSFFNSLCALLHCIDPPISRSPCVSGTVIRGTPNTPKHDW